MTLTSCEQAIHPEGNAIFGYDGGNHFCKKRRARPRGVFAASDKSLPRSRKTPFDLGCSRDTSRGCVGRRCTVLSYTFRSHPYQNTVERGCCSKVFFGLRNNDADSPASRQYTMRAMPSSATMEGTISSEGPVRGVSFAASANKVHCCEVVKFGQSDNWSDISASSAPKIAK